MTSARSLLFVSTIGLSLVALTAAAAAAPHAQAPAPESRAPSAIELALAEHACGPQAPDTSDDARYQCIRDRVDALRADFGYDLSRLTAARRRAIDKACGRLRGALAREAYVACISDQLASLHVKRTAPESAAAPDAAAVAPDSVVAPVNAPPPPPRSSIWMAWLIGFLGAGAVAAGGIVVAMRIKAARHRCRGCGAKVPPTSDLCPDCRKHAAEALRQAAAERAERERAQEEEKRRHEQEAEQRARDEAEARLRREDEERRLREQEEADARLREEETRRKRERHVDSAGSEETFDPYAILGVPRDAAPDAVAAAYEDARSKYDPTSVSHLGDDVQRHYKAKAEAVERAYQMLAVNR